MKQLLTLILIPVVCTAQPFAKESPCFNPDEISNLYQIVKQRDYYKVEYPKRLNDIDSLAKMVYRSDIRLNSYIELRERNDIKLDSLHKREVELAVKEVMLKYGIKENWLGRAWDWVRPRLIAVIIGIGIGKGIDIYLDNN